MSSPEIDRKIAVIFVADVVGYSKHMENDENATFKAYGECETILNKLLKKYKGSIFNTAGDSALAEFPSLSPRSSNCGSGFSLAAMDVLVTVVATTLYRLRGTIAVCCVVASRTFLIARTVVIELRANIDGTRVPNRAVSSFDKSWP